MVVGQSLKQLVTQKVCTKQSVSEERAYTLLPEPIYTDVYSLIRVRVRVRDSGQFTHDIDYQCKHGPGVVADAGCL